MKYSRLAALAAIIPLAAAQTFAADHLDSPLVQNDPAADINDVYAFVNPNDASELVMLKTVVPVASVDSRFSDAVDYEFHVDNGSSSATITCTFDGDGVRVHCAGPGGLKAETGLNQIGMGDGMRVWIGLADDAFFFDLEAFNQTVATLAPQFTDPGTDFFANLNTLVLAVGIDSDRLTDNGANNTLQIYASTDRVGNTGADGSFTGSFFDADNSGHGMTLQVLSPSSDGGPKRLYAIWDVYSPDGTPRYLTGVAPIEGGTAEIQAFETSDGAFPPEFFGDGPTVSEWGTLSFEFDGCSSATMGYDGVDGQGTIDWQRLTSIDGVGCQFLSGGQIDRMGRPAINTALIDLLEDTGLKDQYNRSEDPADWSQFTAEIQSNLEALDTLDGETGNTVLPPTDLAPVLADDRLIVDASIPECDAYLAVELGVAGQCGGRTLSRDVIDDTLGAVVGPGVSDFVGFSSELRDAFPFVALPN
ncbi:DUF4331 domain-containing protein [Wenzhouxiangella sp. XN201]|uniref:DUF4331 family protein n=1 Tax=Wenzhouxiangella sp. XN201 TaxID=2710755 RepID=UPI0013C8AD48|nr:DUF4331 family protein [Wenzhouxiangella sp. XN201]NEZ03277.1 DUF4331 domain-containing protein [Wenzhouxiangella sp. XN201]